MFNDSEERAQKPLLQYLIHLFFQEGEIKKIRNETKILSEILHNQKCELSKMEETLYEYNESVSDFLSSKEQEKIKLDHLKDEYSKKSKTYETQEKLSKNTQLFVCR